MQTMMTTSNQTQNGEVGKSISSMIGTNETNGNDDNVYGENELLKDDNLCIDFSANRQISHAIKIKQAPKAPVFTEYKALDSSVFLKWESTNYRWPWYEIQAFTVHHQTEAFSDSNSIKMDSLRNGRKYTFKVRAKNEFGASEWSENIQLIPLKKPDKPTDIELVCGNGKITVFWLSFDDEMERKEIDGQFEIISDPPTETKMTKQRHKIEFDGLSNDTIYRFMVIAKNANFEVESEWTNKVKPMANKSKKQYKQEKNLAIDQIMKKRKKIKLKNSEKKNNFAKEEKLTMITSKKTENNKGSLLSVIGVHDIGDASNADKDRNEKVNINQTKSQWKNKIGDLLQIRQKSKSATAEQVDINEEKEEYVENIFMEQLNFALSRSDDLSKDSENDFDFDKYDENDFDVEEMKAMLTDLDYVQSTAV